MRHRTTAALVAATLLATVSTGTASHGVDVTDPLTFVASTPAHVVYTATESTVNGQPFLPLGIYGVSNTADFPTVHGYGLNIVQSYHFRDWTDADVLAYLDKAAQNGLMVLFSLNISTEDTAQIAAAKARVTTFKNHPAVYAWYLSDEPSTSSISPATLKGVYDWIKASDLNHPVFTSNWELSSFKDATDLDLRQMYHGPAARLEPATKSYFSQVSSLGENWVAVLNTYDSAWGSPSGWQSLNPASYMSGLTPGTPEYDAGLQRTAAINGNLENPPYPTSDAFPDTPAEVRGAAYWAIINGSNGLYYWLFSTSGAMNTRWGYYTIFHRTATRNAFTATMQQINKLKAFLVNPNVGQVSRWGTSGGVEYWARQTATGPVIIAVNESTTTQTVTTTLPSQVQTRNANLTVDGESRTVKLSSGRFTDTFAPNEAHVYLGPKVRP